MQHRTPHAHPRSRHWGWGLLTMRRVGQRTGGLAGRRDHPARAAARGAPRLGGDLYGAEPGGPAGLGLKSVYTDLAPICSSLRAREPRGSEQLLKREPLHPVLPLWRHRVFCFLR